MQRLGTELCSCTGQEKGIHMLRLGTGMHMQRSGKKVYTC